MHVLVDGVVFFFQAEDGIRDLVRSRGLGDVYKRQVFYENNSYFDGKIYSTGEEISGLEIQVREKATGLDLAVYPAKVSHSYSLGSRSGRSILAFQAERAGPASYTHLTMPTINPV